MNRVASLVAFLVLSSSAVTAHANMGNRTNYYGNRGPQSRVAPKAPRPTSRAVPTTPTLAKVRDAARAEEAAPSVKPLKVGKVQRTWEKAFVKDAGDDGLEVVFPEALVVKAKKLPDGSKAADDVRALVARFGKDRITVFREPKRGTFAIQEATEGESDFRLRVYDPAGALVTRARFGDDGTVDWAEVAASTPAPAPTPKVARPQPAPASREPFRDINRRSGGNI